MKLKFNVKAGNRTIQIEDECNSITEAWQILAFWDSLPTEGPSGEEDLRFSYRTPKGYEYFAIECKSVGKEFKFGQLKDEKGKLFPKHWDEIKHGQDTYEEYEQEEPVPARRQAPPAQSQSAPNQSNNLQNAGTPTEFWKLSSLLKIAKSTAEDIRDRYTKNGQTNWAAAIADLRRAA